MIWILSLTSKRFLCLMHIITINNWRTCMGAKQCAIPPSINSKNKTYFRLTMSVRFLRCVFLTKREFIAAWHEMQKEVSLRLITTVLIQQRLRRIRWLIFNTPNEGFISLVSQTIKIMDALRCTSVYECWRILLNSTAGWNQTTSTEQVRKKRKWQPRFLIIASHLHYIGEQFFGG